MTPVVIAIAAAAFVALRLLHRTGRLRRPAARVGSGRRADPLLGPLGDSGLVAGREIRDRARGRIFRYGTLLGVVGVALAIVIPTLRGTSHHVEQVGVVGPVSPALRAAVTTGAKSIGTKAHIVPEGDLASADNEVRSGRIDLAIVNGSSLVVHKALGSGDSSTTARLARTLSSTLGVERAIHAAGLTPSQASRVAHAGPLPIASLERGRSTAARTTSFIGLPLLFVLFLTYNSWILIGVMEEKSSRVVEVLLATIRPLQLLTGKVLGIGVVALTQAGLIVASALIASEAVGSDLSKGTTPLFLASIFAWLLFGYAFYCWVYAAAGSMAERRDQVQSLLVPLNLPLVFGYIVALSSQGSGTPSTLLRVLAYIPLTAPFAMPALVSLHAVTWWQFVASAALTVVATLAVARLAAAVYRRAILRTGQRVRLRELFPSSSELPGRR